MKIKIGLCSFFILTIFKYGWFFICMTAAIFFLFDNFAEIYGIANMNWKQAFKISSLVYLLHYAIWAILQGE